jgi:hypothetical protein
MLAPSGGAVPAVVPLMNTFTEKHYSPLELAVAWGLSSRFVRDLFRQELVMTIERPEELHKRSYTTIRIPESVAQRVYDRLQRKTRPQRKAA